MQILVVVAITKGSNFWAEVEQGFHRTIFDMKLVGPKEGGENHIKFEKQVYLNLNTPKGNPVKIQEPLLL